MSLPASRRNNDLKLSKFSLILVSKANTICDLRHLRIFEIGKGAAWRWWHGISWVARYLGVWNELSTFVRLGNGLSLLFSSATDDFCKILKNHSKEKTFQEKKNISRNFLNLTKIFSQPTIENSCNTLELKLLLVSRIIRAFALRRFGIEIQPSSHEPIERLEFSSGFVRRHGEWF